MWVDLVGLVIIIIIHTYNTQSFTALLEFVGDYLGEQAPGRVKPIWIYWSKRL